MGFFRNPEIKKSILLLVIVGIIFTAVGFYMDSSAGWLAAVICVTLYIIYFCMTFSRYRNIAKISSLIDNVLHGDDSIAFDSFREGELAILQNELSKMTIRLREQSEALSKDKTYLSDSLADISHQLRTPLTSMNLITEMLREKDLPYERRRALTADLMRLLDRIDWLIIALLKISKIDAGTVRFQQEPVPVQDLLWKAAEPVAVMMDIRGQELQIDVPPDCTYIGDLSWSVEAIGNILKNCMEHTPEGGKLEITASENAIYTQIAICDTGSGIDEEDLPHLFERFYRGKNASESSIGIGLALARMIITKQNGTVKAENRAHGGARFTIRFYKGAV